MEAENHLHETEYRWFAIYTRYKREKIVLKALQTLGVEAYLPLQKVTRVYTRKVKKLEIPLINCYLFVKIVKANYIPVLEIPEVVRFVRVHKSLIAIPEVEINILRRVAGELDAVESEPLGYRPGDQVEIIGGNLTGIKGKLVHIQAKDKVVVDLDTIGYSLIMEIDTKWLRKTVK